MTTSLLFLCFVSISYASLVVLLCVFRACEVQGEAEVMAICLVLGWCNVMFFARGFEMLGPYVIMIQKARQFLYIAVLVQYICVFILSNFDSCFPLDYIWRSDKVHVAESHCAHWVFHL